MATFRGLAAVGAGVLALLEDAWAREPFVMTSLDTGVVNAEGLKQRPFEFGVTLYVYRVTVNGNQRTLPASAPGRRRPLPVDVEFLLSMWGPSATRELELLGWCLRVIDDDPLLPAAVLNRATPGVFAPDEIVELVNDPLPLDEHHRLWDALPWDYQLSAAFTARVVRLESIRSVTEAGAVLERDLAFAADGRDA